MSKPIVYLHIGVAKTGSTTIQRFFRRNRVTLEERGYLYPRSPGSANHMHLAAYAFADNRMPNVRRFAGIHSRKDIAPFRNKFSKELRREISESNAQIVVLSNEHCDNVASDEEVVRLRELLEPVSRLVRIVLYVRRQDDFLLAMYSTEIKNGGQAALELPADVGRYDFYRLVERYARVFGKENVVVQPFERSEMVNGDLLQDFCRIVGIDDLDGFDHVNSSNSSLDAVHLEFLRRFNAHVPRMRKGKLSPSRGNIADVLEQLSDGPKVELDPATLDRFMRQFDESNARLAREYLGREDGVLFRAPRRSGGVSPLAEIPIETAFQIFGDVWKKKQDEVRRLKAEIKGLEMMRDLSEPERNR